MPTVPNEPPAATPPPEAAAGGTAANERAKAALATKKAAKSASTSTSTAVTHTTGSGVKHYTSIMDAFQDPNQKEQIAAALPRSMDVDRFARICVTVVRNNPTLGQCTVVSLLGACMQAAQLGLEPGILGQSYLVPFWNSREGAHDVQFIIGYQGYVELFHRSGKVDDIVAREVCANDEWEFAYGLTDHMRHVPAKKERGEPEVYYGLARLTSGGHNLHVMNLEEIDERRDRSRARDSGPWQTDKIPMSRKTVIRAMAPFLPKSALVAAALAADESISYSITPDMATEVAAQPYIEGDVVDSPPADPAGEPADANGEPAGETSGDGEPAPTE